MRSKGVAKMGEKSTIWTINDVADFFGVSAYSVRRWCRQGYKTRPGARDFRKLERFMVGGVWRWFKSDVVAFAAGGAR